LDAGKVAGIGEKSGVFELDNFQEYHRFQIS
jgi:hypothetical protein